jgi:hypothetical protein
MEIPEPGSFRRGPEFEARLIERRCSALGNQAGAARISIAAYDAGFLSCDASHSARGIKRRVNPEWPLVP